MIYGAPAQALFLQGRRGRKRSGAAQPFSSGRGPGHVRGADLFRTREDMHRRRIQDPLSCRRRRFCQRSRLCACAGAARLGESPDDIIVASLGTGPSVGPIEYGKAKDGRMAGWAKPVMDVMMDGAADAVRCQLEHMLPEDRYYRFNTCLRACDKMDDASGANINALKRDARRIVDGRETSAEPDALCAKLVA